MSIAERTIDLEATRILAERYCRAWNDHDVDSILALHAPVSAFHLHVHPYPEADTPETLRQQFSAILEAMPDLRFETIRLEVRPGLFTHEWHLSTTLAKPFPIGNRVAEPTGRPIRFRGVDVISCEEGLVRRKDCYLDAAGLALQLFPDE